jgi:D-aminoacyl-tRNA deacylase
MSEVLMRAIVQRVKKARVSVESEVIGEIEEGILLLLGAGQNDGEADLKYTLEKVLNLRIFGDENGRMNLSLLDTGGALLVVSQFTLYGDTRKGRRPSYIHALDPEPAEKMIEEFVGRARLRGIHVETGKFGAMMEVELINDGPVTLLIDSTKTF